MKVKVTFLKAAKRDIDEIYTWYEFRRPGLGNAFLKEVEESLNLIKMAPEAYPLKYIFLRTKLLKRFPYGLFYQVENSNNVRIYACLHLRRNVSNILENR